MFTKKTQLTFTFDEGVSVEKATKALISFSNSLAEVPYILRNETPVHGGELTLYIGKEALKGATWNIKQRRLR